MVSPASPVPAQCAVTDGAGSRRQQQQVQLQTIHDVTRVVARNLARLSPAAHSSHAPAKNCNNLSWKQSITRPALASTVIMIIQGAVQSIKYDIANICLRCPAACCRPRLTVPMAPPGCCSFCSLQSVLSTTAFLCRVWQQDIRCNTRLCLVLDQKTVVMLSKMSHCRS